MPDVQKSAVQRPPARHEWRRIGIRAEESGPEGARGELRGNVRLIFPLWREEPCRKAEGDNDYEADERCPAVL